MRHQKLRFGRGFRVLFDHRRVQAAQMVLETGTMQPDAIALYEASGYTPTVAFGHYADSELSRYYAKPVSAPPA